MFGESLSSLKLENILGLDKTKGNSTSLVCQISLQQRCANNDLSQ